MLKTLRIGLAAAFMVLAGSAFAATPSAELSLDELVTAPVVADCLASFDLSAVILLVEAETGCDATLAEATGLCLVPAESAAHWDAVAVLDPELGISCTAGRPSPPG